MTPLADLARAMFAAAVGAVQPAALVRRIGFIPAGVEYGGETLAPSGRLVLVAIGKASPGLASAFLARTQRRPNVTFVLAPYGVPTPPELRANTRFASHPVPDASGGAATGELLDLLGGLDPSDGVVLLLSGGGSALLAQPLPGLSLDDLGALTRAVLAAGAPIHELNAVRKHLLAAAGGRMALRCPAPIVTLALSDVPGDDLATIASGPTVADPTTFADALDVLERRGLAASFPQVVALLAAGRRGDHEETAKPGDPRLARSRAYVVASSREALDAAAAVAAEAGARAVQLGRTVRGEAREVGAALAALARALAPGEPVALLAAGETTVTVRGHGCGGRNLEVALAAALGLADVPERCVLAGGTDGVDGLSPAAGAVVDGGTVARGAAARERDAVAALEDNDAWGYFHGAPEAIVTGPTGTNVADLMFVLAAGSPPRFLAAEGRLARPLPARP